MEFGAISETLPEPPRGTNAWFFHNPQISRSQSTTEYLLVAASKVTATMATAWDRIDETYRSYLTGSSISTLEFNELPATGRATLRNAFLLQQQLQQQQPCGKLICYFCILVFNCCFEYGNYSLCNVRVVVLVCLIGVLLQFLLWSNSNSAFRVAVSGAIDA
jgi:hypothetical protein